MLKNTTNFKVRVDMNDRGMFMFFYHNQDLIIRSKCSNKKIENGTKEENKILVGSLIGINVLF